MKRQLAEYEQLKKEISGNESSRNDSLMADVYNVSTGCSNATEVKLKQQINNENYASGFTMELMAKDLKMADALAGDMAIDAPGLAACAELYARAVAELGGKADHTAVMRVIEGQE